MLYVRVYGTNRAPYLVALAKTYVFDLGITCGLLSINSSTAAPVSGVSMIGTVLPRLPVIPIRLGLRL